VRYAIGRYLVDKIRSKISNGPNKAMSRSAYGDSVNSLVFHNSITSAVDFLEF